MEFYLHFTSKKTVCIAQLIPENDLKFVSLIVDYDFEALGLPKPFWKDRINKIFCWCLSQKNNTAIRLKILKSNESCNLIG